jgi:hypothetical protein
MRPLAHRLVPSRGIATTVLTLLALLLLPTCGPRSDGRPDGGGGGARPDFGLGDVTPLEARAQEICTAPTPEPVSLHTADVLILFDRSESMSAAFGEGTRYGVEAETLAALLPLYDGRLRFGFGAFPSSDACAGGEVIGCCAAAPSVAVGADHVVPILAAIQAADPVGGNTPTAQALRRAYDHYQALGPSLAKRYVLLATDGRPNCTADGRLSEADAACKDALLEADHLWQAGIKLVVMGIGPGLETDPDGAPSCLDALARRGGNIREDAPLAFFPVSDRFHLERALEQIFGGVERPDCHIDLGKRPADPTRVRVLFDGREIPRSRVSGWDFMGDDPRYVTIVGAWCTQLEHFAIKRVEVQFGCPPCGEERSCG